MENSAFMASLPGPVLCLSAQHAAGSNVSSMLRQLAYFSAGMENGWHVYRAQHTLGSGAKNGSPSKLRLTTTGPAEMHPQALRKDEPARQDFQPVWRRRAGPASTHLRAKRIDLIQGQRSEALSALSFCVTPLSAVFLSGVLLSRLHAPNIQKRLWAVEWARQRHRYRHESAAHPAQLLGGLTVASGFCTASGIGMASACTLGAVCFAHARSVLGVYRPYPAWWSLQPDG